MISIFNSVCDSFATTPLTKASHMAKPGVIVGIHYQKAQMQKGTLQPFLQKNQKIKIYHTYFGKIPIFPLKTE